MGIFWQQIVLNNLDYQDLKGSQDILRTDGLITRGMRFWSYNK